VHHQVASDWFESLSLDTRLCFCRFTQFGFLRLLTAKAVMGGEALDQIEAWKAYDAWRADERVRFLDEPEGLERRFRARTRSHQSATKAWGDAYLAAFAEVAQLTLVTFDRAFSRQVKPLILLEI
jgi:toxin-antitoxin system PIN domain toxin